MAQFLSILLRNQFNLFYRFGYTGIPKPCLIAFDGNIDDETKENVIKQFAAVSPFEYDEEYLILHLEKAIDSESDFVQFETQDIVAVYPLSQQAKKSIEAKIDRRIRLERPIFESILPTIETKIEIKEVEKAIEALWAMCKIESPLEKDLSDIGIENIFKGLEYRKNGTKSFGIQSGNYWEFLIAYDRFDYFPNSTLGYFYDAGQVLAYTKGLPTFVGSAIHNFLEKLNSENPAVKFPDIISCLETEEQLKGYVSQTTTGDIKQYVIAPLFLMLRDEIRKSDDIAQTRLFMNLAYLKKFENSFNYTVILVGAFFGFRKFYDIYYEALNLRFYKNFEISQKETTFKGHQEHVTTDTKREVSKIFAADKKVEQQSSNDKSEERQTLKQEDHTKDEEIPIAPTVQQDEKERESDISSHYQKIIEEALVKQLEVKLTDIASMIKERTGKKIQNNIIEKIAKGMNEIEIIKIGKAKGIRQKKRTLFSE